MPIPPCPRFHTKDEMGEMARALEVLQAGELERRKLVERERAEQVTQRQRVPARSTASSMNSAQR